MTTTTKNIVSAAVVLSIVIAGAFYFYETKKEPEFIPEVQEEVVKEPETRRTAKDIVENALYKRIDFINKFISDFNLNSHVGKDPYYKNGENYILLTPSSLLSLSMDELAEIYAAVESDGIFFQEPDGTFIAREKQDR